MIGYIKRLAGPFKGDGRDTVFSFGFKVFSNQDIYVAMADEGSAKSTILNFGSDYTARMNEDQDATPGGSITLSSALPVGKVLSIVSNVAYTQEVNLTNYSRFPPSIINQGLDRLEIQIQQLKEKSDRHLAVPETSDKTPDEVMTEVLDTAANAAEYAEQAKETLETTIEIDREVREIRDTVAADKTAVAGMKATVEGLTEQVLENKDNIDIVAGGIDNVKTVAENYDDIAELAQNAQYIGTVGQNIDDVKAVAGNEAAIQQVANLGFEASSTTLEPNQQATATATIEGNKWKVAFGIPRGVDGVIGRDGEKGADGEKGEKGDPGVYVGSDTPEGYTVYVDPTGDPDISLEEIEQMKTDLSGKLDKSGGVMTGAIEATTGNFVKCTSNNGNLTFYGGTSWNNGAYINLKGGENSSDAGTFQITANNSETAKALFGKPDGTLTWGGNEVERVTSSGSRYIRYESGIQICWGSGSPSNGWATCTLAQPFKNNQYAVTLGSSARVACAYTNATTTSLEIGTVNGTATFMWYMCIGRWK